MLRDFFPTRFVEVVVHGEDLAASVGLDPPGFSPEAWATTASVVLHHTTGSDAADRHAVLTALR